MFWPMIQVEQKKLLRGRLFWISLGLMVLFLVTIFAFMFWTRDAAAFSPEERIEIAASVTWPEALYGSLVMIAQVGALILVAVAGALAAQEYGWGTMALWVSHGVSRPVVLATRFITIVGTIFIYTVVPLLFLSLMSALFTVTLQGNLDPAVVNFGQVALGAVRTTYVVLPYLGVAFLLGVLTRSTVGAIGGGALFLLLIEPVLIEILQAIGGFAARLAMFLPDMLATSVFNLNLAIANPPLAPPDDLPALPAPGAAVVFIAVYTLVLFGAAVWVFQRQDLNT